MKKIFLLILFYIQFQSSYSQTPYWQQQVNYKIDVSLNTVEHSLNGNLKIQYFNNSDDTLYYIWFHVWPNAYKNDRTAFSDQLLENGRKDFYFSNEDQRGYINRLDFKVDGTTAVIEDHAQHQDILKLVLPKPLPPKSSVNIETPFHVKLPENYSRGGHIKDSYQATQWYPKPAVYDRKGWHEMPYLDQGEFYSEFGEYDVQITVPAKYIVASTGIIQEEKMEDSLKIVQYTQNNIHDFAWFADPEFLVKHDTLQLATKTIDIFAYYNKANEALWKNSIDHIKAAIKTKSEWLGEYPYRVVSVVESRQKSGGGMEYPTITLVSSPGNEKELDMVINHEVGHNWFYGILGSNERQHPWMDEGMNSYYDKKYLLKQYGNEESGIIASKNNFLRNRMPSDPENILLETLTSIKKDQPIETRSEDFSVLNYNAVAYIKTAQWMKLLENEIGQPVFEQLMQEYYNRWQFKHPYPEDFKLLAEEISGKKLDPVFSLLNKKGSLQKPVKKNLRVTSFFGLKETNKHHFLFVMPAIGFNNYDRWMVGGLIHNYTLPVNKFQFVMSPLYATGSKQLNGIGRAGYNLYPGRNGQHLEFAVSFARFSADSFTDSTGTVNYLQFSKIVPSMKFVFANKNPRSSIKKYIQWKTFLINETSLLFERDTIQNKDLIKYPVEHRYINQLQFVIENNRVLYPYNAVLQNEQGKGFLRFNFTGNYYFNFEKGGGMNVRLFAGKFIYTGEKTFISQYETDRYHLNMTGPKGNEDYTYSNYFVGRNDFAYSLYNPESGVGKNAVRGAPIQQIMQRDGFFKVRADLLSSKIGRSDDWLSAMNFTTTIPKQVNPMELLPFKIPLKLFLDIGTYAEAWDKNASTEKFLYDAGFQLSLFKNVLNIYLPILYSKEYKEYINSLFPEKKVLKNISFSIDLQNVSLKKLFPQSPF
ncbi:MAG: M1 family metallopeptidase [Ferruginibacter sp.]